MFFFAQTAQGKSDPDFLVGSLAVMALCFFGVWKFFRWLSKSPKSPDPWNDEVAAEIANDDATPLCHHCLAPHSSGADFCPECGASVGKYTNWLPYLYLFSIGHVLRIGTSEHFKHSPLTVVGFLIFSLIEYAFFAPIWWLYPLIVSIYWFMLLRNTLHKHEPDPSADRPTGDIPPDRRPDET